MCNDLLNDRLHPSRDISTLLYKQINIFVS